MYKLLLLLLFLVSISLATTRDAKSDTEAEKTGFYYYKDANVTKKAPASPAQKMQADLTKELIKTMKKNNELQKKILKRLEYAFPDTIPEYTINKKTGKKCKSNSIADCFVMPVTQEAQKSVPVLATMLRNPNTKNVKNYLEWQAVYFNQTFKVGKGFSLVSKQYEREVNKLDGMGHTQMPHEGNKQNQMAEYIRAATIKKLDNKLGLMLFIGKTKELERNMNAKDYIKVLTSTFGEMQNITYIFETQEDKNWIEQKLKQFKHDNDFEKYSKVRSIVSSKEFKRFKINVTPASVIIYKKDDGGILWQKLGYTIEPLDISRMVYRFLSFHDIVKPANINEKDAWQMATDIREGKGLNVDIINNIDINESKIDALDEQYIVRPNKGKN